MVRVKVLQERIARLEERKRVGEKEKRVVVLENTLPEAEEEKGAPQLKLVDLEEVMALEARLKVRVREAEVVSRRMGDELGSRHRAMELGEGEREDLLEALGSWDTAIHQLEAEAARQVAARGLRCVGLDIIYLP